MTSYQQFKEMYNDDPTFREKVKEHKNAKIKCPNGCGQVVSRSNMSAHKRSDACKKYCELNIDVTTNEINKLKERVTNLEKLLKNIAKD